MAELPGGLLEAVRNYLDITWTDDAGDEKLSGIISRGMAYLDRVAGDACDYISEAAPRALLFDYCRYARSNALEEFQANYLHELLDLQASVAVASKVPKAQLARLTIGSLTLTPAFSAAVYEYAATTENDSDTVTAAASYFAATLALKVNGMPIENGGAAEWNAGENVLTTSVTHGELTLEYAVVVTR